MNYSNDIVEKKREREIEELKKRIEIYKEMKLSEDLIKETEKELKELESEKLY